MSHVEIATQICPVCGSHHQNGGEILLHKYLRDIKLNKDGEAVTGWYMCKEHKQLEDDKFVACIEIDETKSSEMTINDVWRTGNYVHIKFEAAQQIFGLEKFLPITFIEIDVIDKLKELIE